MLKIYGGDLSAPANKVRFVANVIGLDFEYIPVKIRDGEHRRPEFFKINPVGKIPAIDDDGFFLFESNAIAKYLARKHNSSLYPGDVKAQAEVDAWVDFASMHIHAAMSKVVFNTVFYQFAKAEKDERSLSDGRTFLQRFLPVADAQIGKGQFLWNNTFSLADIVLLSALDPAEVAQVDLSGYRNIVRWRNALRQRDFYIKTFDGKGYGEPLKRAARK